MNIRKIVCFLFLVALLLCRPALAHSFDQEFGLWSDVKIYGRFFKEKLNYEIESHLRFLSKDPIFNQAIEHFGLGYSIHPSVRLWGAYEFLPTYEPFTDKLEYEQRLLQQLSIHAIDDPKFAFYLRTRLEQRDDLDESGIAWRLRQMFTVMFHNRIRNKISPFLSDEIFFNLNHPDWVSKDTVNQNRFYVGISIPWKKYAKIRLSYINQIIVGGQVHDMNHIFYISFLLNHDLL